MNSSMVIPAKEMNTNVRNVVCVCLFILTAIVSLEMLNDRGKVVILNTTFSTRRKYKTYIPTTCEERNETSNHSKEGNIAFIKTHKTASSTLAGIIERYGVRMNLSFVIMRNSQGGHLRAEILSKKSPQKLFLPVMSRNVSHNPRFSGYNMSTIHVRYQREIMDTYMEPCTRYVTILREPSSQWISSFTFFNFRKYLPKEEQTSEGNKDIKSFLSFSKGRLSKIGSSYVWNSQSFDLGLQKPYFENELAVDEMIGIIDTEFDLVMISEYFDQSLLLLKNLMRWDYTDILYLPRNQQAEHRQVSEVLRDQIRRLNTADTKLYNFFNQSFWTKVKEYGSSFEADLMYFRNMLNWTYFECVGGTKVSLTKTAARRRQLVLKEGSGPKCEKLHKNYFSTIYKRQSAEITPK